MINEKSKSEETFIIKILSKENATWQGSITWAEQNKAQYFRSALELLKLLDSVLDKESENGGEFQVG